MSKKRYDSKCIVCKKEFIAKKRGTKFCSNVCRAQYSRDNRLKLIENQSKVIRTHEAILRQVAPDPVMIKKVSNEVGKDLTECKRPDGSHLYTETDLWILVAKLVQVGFTGKIQNFASASGPPLLSVLNTNQLSMNLISDFERRFQCKFDDVRRSSPYVHAADDGSEDEILIDRYASMEYSR